MNKQTLSRNISKIFSMGINELIEFKKKLSINNIDNDYPKEAFYLHQAIEKREIELQQRQKAMVEDGEVKRGGDMTREDAMNKIRIANNQFERIR